MKRTLRSDKTGGGPNSTSISTRSGMTVPVAQVHGKWVEQEKAEVRFPDGAVSPSDATPTFITDSEIRSSFAQVSTRLGRLEGRQPL
jgi:hypothetical protein